MDSRLAKWLSFIFSLKEKSYFRVNSIIVNTGIAQLYFILWKNWWEAQIEDCKCIIVNTNVLNSINVPNCIVITQ